MLFSINIVLLFVLASYLLLKYQNNSHNRVLKLVSYFVISYFVGFVLLVLRNQIPDFFSIVVANTFFAMGSLNLYVATKTMLDLDSKWHYRYTIPILVIFLSFILFTYINFDTSMRMIIYFSFVAIYSWLSFYLFWRYSSEKLKVFDKLSAVVFLIVCFNALFIIVRVFLKNVPSYYFGSIDMLIYLPSINMLLLNLWVVFLIKYRIKS